MKFLFSFFSFVFLTAQLNAQNTADQWEKDPVQHRVNYPFQNESAVVLSDIRTQEFVPSEKKGMRIILTARKLIRISDDNGVEMYNKIYLPVYFEGEILQLKARVILKNGKIINLPADKFLDAEEEGRKYKKFALEGVEKGSEIEYIYQVEKAAAYFGVEVFQSSSTPIEKAVFTLITPAYLSFSLKGYNGFAVSADSVTADKRIITATCKNIPATTEEKYGNRDAHSKHIQYKLSYNLSKDKNVRLFTWNDLAKNVYSNWSAYSEKEAKAAEGFLKSSGIQASLEEEAKIIALEDYIKSTINTEKNAGGEDAGKIDKIIKTKLSDNSGLYRLFAVCMDKLNIQWQIVFPSKRDDLPLDEGLENYKLADEILFYFPGTSRFLEPANSSFRYPYVTPYWAGTKGLFLEGTSIGNFKTALASFRDIYMQPMEQSAHNMEVSLHYDKSNDSLLIHNKQIMKGYAAAVYRPAYNFTQKDKLDDLSKQIMNIGEGANVKNIRVQNTSFTDGSSKPLIIEGDITGTGMIEVAGNKLLLKIGEAIGPQVQMYQEKERQLPVSIQYPHVLDREITFTIPAGYTIKNPDDLDINITDKNSGKETMGFVSSHKITGSELKVLVHEFYSVTDYPLESFNDFKKVINASADFNKIVLVLEKK